MYHPRAISAPAMLIACLLLFVLASPTAFAGGSPTCPTAGTVVSEIKISQLFGGFGGQLQDVDHFGRAIANIGDLNNDGVEDLAVGASLDDDGGPDRGAVWILFLNNNGLVISEQKISSTAGGFVGQLDDDDQFGVSVAALGDWDNDGVEDIAVGSRLDDDGGSGRGAVWILYLNPDGTVKAHQKISSSSGGLTGPLKDFDQFGIGVASIGDLDGNESSDLLVGAWQDDDGGINRGAVWILFFNSAGTVIADQKISALTGNFSGQLSNSGGFGVSVAAIGDVNGDLIADIAVGNFLDDDGGPDRGAVWIIFLASNGTVLGARKVSDTDGNLQGSLLNGDQFGISVCEIGDIDSDGVSDLAVGALGTDDGGDLRGAVWICFLNTDGTIRGEQKISSTSGSLAGPLANGDQLGISVAKVGDLNNNGQMSIAVGAQSDDDGGTDRGAIWLLELDGCPLPPSVNSHPTSVLLPQSGGIAKFSVTATGEQTLLYQWRRDTIDLVDGGHISGATTNTLTVTATQADVGNYDCVVTNNFGTATSNTAVLALRTTCPADIAGSGGPGADGMVDVSDLFRLLADWGECD